VSARLFAFEDVWLVGGDATKRPGRTSARNGTVVAVDATVVANLQVQGTVPKGLAPLHALAATNAQGFVNPILEIGVFDKRPLDGSDRTELVFRCRVQLLCLRAEIATAQVAVTAHVVGMDALHRGWREDAFRGTTSALCALLRIELPERVPALCTPVDPDCTGDNGRGDRPLHDTPQELPA